MKTLFALALLLLSFTASAGDFITGTQARQLIQDKGAILVDVRTPEEFATKHVIGALHFPVQTIDADLYHFGAFDRPIVVYCRSGHRAGIAKEALMKAGFKEVYNMGPIDNWEQ